MAIPSVVMDTTVLPPSQQFAAWSEHSRWTRLSQTGDGPFLARGRLWDLGPVHLTRIELDPFTSVRDDAHVNAGDGDHVQIVHVIAGEVSFEADGKTHDCRQGTLFVRDYARPSVADTRTRIVCHVVYLARDYLAETSRIEGWQGKLPDTAETSILRDTMLAMSRHLDAADAASAGVYAATLRELVAAALARVSTSGRKGDTALLAAAHDYIASQGPGMLTIDGICAALNVSRSTLYRLFERHGGVLAYDRMRRLRALYRAVSNPANTSPLGELAMRYGFADKAALSRSFRKAFGCSPGELRAQRRSGAFPVEDTPALAVLRAVERIN